MLGVVLPKPPFQLQLFLIFPRNENQSHSKSKFLYLWGSEVTMDFQSVIFDLLKEQAVPLC